MFDIRFQVMLREVNREKRVSILTLNPYDTVFKLKTYLSNNYGHSISQLVLFCNNKQLLNDKETIKNISIDSKKLEVFYRCNNDENDNDEPNEQHSIQTNNSLINAIPNHKINIEEDNDNEEEEEESDDTYKIHTLDDFFKIADEKEKKKNFQLRKKTQRDLLDNSNDDIDLYKREFNPNIKELLDLFQETKYPVVYKIIKSEKDINKNKPQINIKNLIESLNIQKSSISLEELTLPLEKINKENSSILNNLKQSLIKPKQETLYHQRHQYHQQHSQFYQLVKNSPLTFQAQFESILQTLQWASVNINTVRTILNTINQMKIESDLKTRLNIVFDLDNTLMYSALASELKFTDNLINIQCQTHKGVLYMAFKFRKGIEQFIQSTRAFSNYYVYSLGMVAYVDEIVKELEKRYQIKIVNRIGRKTIDETRKDLSLLFPDQRDREMSVIIDDLNRQWGSYYIYIINSMKFLDSFCISNSTQQFSLNDFRPLHYNCNVSEENWTKTQFNHHENYLAENSDETHIPLHAEYDKSNKMQFNYLGEIMRKTYLISISAKVPTDIALAFIRKTTLMGCVFSLKYCFMNHDIHQMIITLGGKVCNEHIESNKNNYNGNSFRSDNDGTSMGLTHMVISNNMFNEYKKHKHPINKEVYVVNNKYVFHSYYFLQKMNEKDKEYQPFG